MNFVKDNIIEKTHLIIQEYCKLHRINKYLCRKCIRCKLGNEYTALLLDENRLYEHSKHFKENKKKLVDRRGNRTSDFYKYCDRWYADKHAEYVIVKHFIYNLVDNDLLVNRNDFEYLNNLYRELVDKNGKVKHRKS